MPSANHPAYVPIVLPHDGAALEAAPRQEAVVLSAVYGSNPRLAELVALARRRADHLFVDPKTPHFQFEGYLSMPDYRALPYSPGRHTLGTLWHPAQFGASERRRHLIDKVFAVQRELGADVLLAPYFYIRQARHPWREVAARCAAEAIEAAAPEPVGVPLSVDIDALLDEEQRAEIGAAFRGLDAHSYWVNVINYDERLADPADTRALLAFLAILQESGRPVILSHAGRVGLLAIAAGAAGYSAGAQGFEHHPRQFFREMMGTRPANHYYLHECFLRLPVRAAAGAIDLPGPASHPACGCPACGGSGDVTRMVSRRLALHSLLWRLREVEELGAVPAAQRRAWLIERFTAALERTRAIADALDRRNDVRGIEPGEYHYLEVLREAAGGPAASRPADDDLG